MARTQGTNARTQRLTALLATALLATATAFAIGRVFVDHASTYRMAVAGLLSAAIAVALERRSLLLATLVSAAAMIAVVGFMVFPETTWHGVPTLETLRAMVDAAGLVGEQARVQVAPDGPSPPLMLAALTATWAAIFSAHALGVPRRKSDPGAASADRARRVRRHGPGRDRAPAVRGRLPHRGYRHDLRRRAATSAGMGAGVDRPGTRCAGSASPRAEVPVASLRQRSPSQPSRRSSSRGSAPRRSSISAVPATTAFD